MCYIRALAEQTILLQRAVFLTIPILAVVAHLLPPQPRLMEMTELGLTLLALTTSTAHLLLYSLCQLDFYVLSEHNGRSYDAWR